VKQWRIYNLKKGQEVGGGSRNLFVNLYVNFDDLACKSVQICQRTLPPECATGVRNCCGYAKAGQHTVVGQVMQLLQSIVEASQNVAESLQTTDKSDNESFLAWLFGGRVDFHASRLVASFIICVIIFVVIQCPEKNLSFF